MKPALFVDVDGVISLWGFPSDRRPAGEFVHVDGILHFLSAAAVEHLPDLASSFGLVWCTGWEERANDYLPARLRLPASLPFLTFSRNPGRTHAHWKLDAIDAYAGNRPAAWIDDALDDVCRAWAAARAAPTLLVQTDPAVGLTAANAEQLHRWAVSPPRDNVDGMSNSAAQEIDARIAELGDWRGETLSRLRALIKRADPDVVEEWKWKKASNPGVPVWSHQGIICTGETYKSVVKLTFMKGASLEDPAGLFNSSLEGNTRRAIDVHEGDEIDEQALTTLIQAAVSFNESS